MTNLDRVRCQSSKLIHLTQTSSSWQSRSCSPDILQAPWCIQA
jgi:hypothetical protein